jgi:hypothetical protein
MPNRTWGPLLRRLTAPRRKRPPTRLGRDWRLEDRLAPVAGLGQAFDDAGRGLPGNNSDVSDFVLRVYNAYQDAGAKWATADPADAMRALIDDSGRMEIRVTAQDVDALRPALVALGFVEAGAAPEQHLIEGWLPFSALPAAAGLTSQGMLGILPVLKPELHVGLTTSQGTWVTEADRVQTASPTGFDGTGVKVGVLSDSYAQNTSLATTAAQDIANGDLPAAGVSVLAEGPSGSTDEGRAMLQIVHDVAPGASLAFATASNGETSFANNIVALKNAGAKVIVDDIGYLTEPMFQYGIVGNAVRQVTNAGANYFSAAGNEADQSWEQVNPTTQNTTVYGHSGTYYNFSGTDVTQRITIPTGAAIEIVLQWDQPFYTTSGVTSNVNILLYQASNGAQVASSTDNNLTTQMPFEYLAFQNTSATSTAFDLVLQNAAGPVVTRLKYVYYPHPNGIGNFPTINEYATNSSSMFGHPGTPEAIGVGAVPYYDQRTPEPYTSSGPMTVIFNANGTPISGGPVITNPVVAAPDDVNTSFFYPGDNPDNDARPNFAGTSAAAPHAAAVAALMLQANPSLTPAQLRANLIAAADPATGAAGFDKYTGNGLVDAYKAIFGPTRANAGGSFSDGFDVGGLGPNWEAYSTGAGHIQVTTSNGPISGGQVVLQERYGDSGTGGSAVTLSRNELTLHVNPTLPTSTGVLLFSEKEFNDDDNPMPASFTGSSNSDGVAFSVDGTNWFRLVSLTGTTSTNSYQAKAFDLVAAAQAAGVALTADTRIRFQQYDDQIFPNDGIAFDNVKFGINQVPAFTKGGNQVVNEDSGPASVPGWATGVSAGPAALGQEDARQAVDFIVTTNNDALFWVLPAIDSSGNLTYTPAPDANGTATITVKIHDNGGTAGGGQDTSATQTFTITVNPVNDPPSFTKGADDAVNEDSGARTVPGWATNISAGPPDESGQTVAFQATNDNNALFAVQPAIDPTGQLTYTPAPDANGSATVTVTAQDNGGGANTSAPQTFTITVNPINDAPSFTKGADQSAEDTAGPQVVVGWATNLSAGPADESGQVLTFQTSVSDPALFAVQPAIDGATGTLTYTPAPGTVGTATVTVTLTDDGGTANGGVDTAPSQTFTITITSSSGNHAPTANDDAINAPNGGSIHMDVLANDTDPDGDTLSVQSFTQPAHGTVTADGTGLRYTSDGTPGTFTFDYTVSDGRGGTDQATVTVHSIVQPPPFVKTTHVLVGPGKAVNLTDRMTVLGFSTVNKVSIAFDQPVNVDIGDLTVTGLAGAYPITAFAYNAATHTATWTLGQAIGTLGTLGGRDRVTIHLDGTSPTGVTSQATNQHLAADLVRTFGVLPGDLDGDGVVTQAELKAAKRLIGKRYPALKAADVDGDGVVTKKDLAIIAANVGKRLP